MKIIYIKKPNLQQHSTLRQGLLGRNPGLVHLDEKEHSNAGRQLFDNRKQDVD